MAKPDGLVPIPLVLDLWALGHSQADVAEKLGLPNGKHVERIVERARQLGDRRAVFHATGGRIIGKGIPAAKRFVKGRHPRYQGFEIVDRILKPLCPRGHAMTPENRRPLGGCRICQNEFARA
jgi:hypothetical protein